MLVPGRLLTITLLVVIPEVVNLVVKGLTDLSLVCRNLKVQTHLVRGLHLFPKRRRTSFALLVNASIARKSDICPKGNTVKSSGNKPPGVSNFAIGLDDDNGTYMSTLTDTTEAISLGIMGFDIIESDEFSDLPSLASISDSDEESDNESVVEMIDGHIVWEDKPVIPEPEDSFSVGNEYLSGTNLYHQIGDPASRKLMHMLERLGPYPGDNTYYGYDAPPRGASTRFLAFTILGGRLALYNSTPPLLDLLPRRAQPLRRQASSLSSPSLNIALSDHPATASIPFARTVITKDVETAAEEDGDPTQTRGQPAHHVQDE